MTNSDSECSSVIVPESNIKANHMRGAWTHQKTGVIPGYISPFSGCMMNHVITHVCHLASILLLINDTFIRLYDEWIYPFLYF